MKRSADATFDIPEASSSSITLHEAPSPTASVSSDAQPPRKRSRSDLTTEERKEARAHRNRIAAQNSRDRRKAQFTFLERRVAELEEENRQLKANMGLTQLRNSSENTTSEQSEREQAREKENEELRERIKTLENGWDAVVKALAASGLPLQIPTPSGPSTEPSSSSSNPTNTFPVMIQPSPTFPLTPVSSTSTSSPSSERDFDEFESTRHLARVATTDAPPLSSLEFLSTTSTIPLSSSDIDLTAPAIPQGEAATSPADEALMQDLLREILAASPTITTSALPTPTPSGEVTSTSVFPDTSMAPMTSTTMTGGSDNWDGEAEMQKLLDMLPGVQPETSNAGADLPSALDHLEMCGWDMGQYLQTSTSTVPLVGAF